MSRTAKGMHNGSEIDRLLRELIEQLSTPGTFLDFNPKLATQAVDRLSELLPNDKEESRSTECQALLKEAANEVRNLSHRLDEYVKRPKKVQPMEHLLIRLIKKDWNLSAQTPNALKTGLSEERITIEELLTLGDNDLKVRLMSLRNIGPKLATEIINGRNGPLS